MHTPGTWMTGTQEAMRQYEKSSLHLNTCSSVIQQNYLTQAYLGLSRIINLKQHLKDQKSVQNVYLQFKVICNRHTLFTNHKNLSIKTIL